MTTFATILAERIEAYVALRRSQPELGAVAEKAAMPGAVA